MNSITLLVLASLGLLVGPLCGSIGARVRSVHALVDGFARALVGGLCVVFVLPHAVGEIGIAGLLLAALGVALPSLCHRLWRGRSWSLGLVALALAAHAVLDGAVLAIGGGDTPLGWAVVAHRLPVGFAIVVAAHASRKSAMVSWGLSLTMVGATVLGYVSGPSVVAWLSESAPAALEAIVAGVLLHVVLVPHATEPEAPTAVHKHRAGAG